jgi:hypothetical protein
VWFTVSARATSARERRAGRVRDGGFTDWIMRLTASSKERLLISGLAIERLAPSLESG